LFGINRPEFVSAAKINGGKRVVGIERTTKESIAEIISRGIANGTNQSDLKKAILSEMDISKARAKLIARQETATALATGQFDMMKSAGAGTKTWHHRPQKNPRDGSRGPNHVALEGETVQIDAKFSNGLKYPRDPNDPRPEEIINCRCYLTYSGFDKDATSSDEIGIPEKTPEDIRNEPQPLKTEYSTNHVEADDYFEGKLPEASNFETSLLKGLENSEINDILAKKLSKSSGITVSPERAKADAEAVVRFTTDNWREVRDAYVNPINASKESLTDFARLEDFISLSPKYDDEKVFRGIGVSPEDLASYKSGQVLDMGGPTSWTSNYGEAEKYAAGSTPEKKIVFCFRNKPYGTAHGTLNGTSLTHLSGSPWEEEILVSSKQRYKVLRVGKIDQFGNLGGKYTVIELCKVD
jgi:hypothetical protein